MHKESVLPAQEMARLIQERPPGSWPVRRVGDASTGKDRDDPAGSWRCWANTQEAMRLLASAKVSELTGMDAPPPSWGRWEGKGVVMCGGAAPVLRAGLPHGYLPSAWVHARRLRDAGCRLPIQLWHLGPNEMDLALSRMLHETLGVETVDALDHPEAARVRILAGWELKPFAALMSPFREVVFLDADAVSIPLPEAMLGWRAYRDRGAVFFPDFDHQNFMGRLTQGVWDIFGIPARDEPSFESGQFMVDKGRCWRELRMALWYAEHSDFTFGHVYGDKECFHLGWRRLGTEYAMPPKGPGWEGECCIVQHAFDGTPAVLHRCQDKWRLDGRNRRVSGLVLEEELHAASAQLRGIWNGLLWHAMDNAATTALRRSLEGCRFDYRRLPTGGFAGDERVISLEAGGTVGEGAAGCEAFWTCQEWGVRRGIALHGASGLTCALALCGDGVFRGRWADHERCGVELRPRP